MGVARLHTEGPRRPWVCSPTAWEARFQLQPSNELGCVSPRHSPPTFKAGAAHCLLRTLFRENKACWVWKDYRFGQRAGLKGLELWIALTLLGVDFKCAFSNNRALASAGPKGFTDFPSWWQIVQLHPRRHKTPSSHPRFRSIDFQLWKRAILGNTADVDCVPELISH